MRGNRLIAFCFTRLLPIALALGSVGGWAQTADSDGQPTISSLIQQIKELQQQDRELQERIRALEANQKSAPPEEPSPAASSEPEKQPAVPNSVPTVAPTPAPEMHSFHAIQWRGYGELDYKILDQRTPETGTYGFVPGSSGNFYTGDFGLFVTSRLSDRTSVLGELDFEEKDAQRFKVDLRRMLLKWDVSDHLKLSFGRYQTYIGYYNWAFRSAAWLQTTADRPLVMEFATNGGLLPTQAVGIAVTGSIPSGQFGMHYIAEYGSSDTIRPDINGDGLFNDENNGNQVNLGFYIQPDFARGLRIGGSFYHDQISDLVITSLGQSVNLPGFPPASARWGQTIVNGHVVYTANGIEFLNEGFLIRHALVGGPDVFNTASFYSQFSKRLGRTRPFVRYQYVNAGARNPIYDDIGFRAGPSFGARFDFNDYLAIKAQLDHTVRRGLPDLNGLHLQVSGTF